MPTRNRPFLNSRQRVAFMSTITYFMGSVTVYDELQDGCQQRKGVIRHRLCRPLHSRFPFKAKGPSLDYFQTRPRSLIDLYCRIALRQMERSKRAALVHLLTALGGRTGGNQSSAGNAHGSNRSGVVASGRDVLLRCLLCGILLIRVATGRRVAPVLASAGRNGRRIRCLPAGIQGELRLRAIYSGIEVVSLGAILVSEPAREGVAFLVGSAGFATLSPTVTS